MTEHVEQQLTTGLLRMYQLADTLPDGGIRTIFHVRMENSDTSFGARLFVSTGRGPDYKEQVVIIGKATVGADGAPVATTGRIDFPGGLVVAGGGTKEYGAGIQQW